MAAPMPWSARAAVSASIVGAIPQSADATVRQDGSACNGIER
jgi:hypothetical protein